MKELFKLAILGFLAIGTQTGQNAIQYTLGQANRIYRQCWQVIRILLGMVLAGFILNIIGIKEANIIFAVFFLLVALVVWSRPVYLGIITGTAAALTVLQQNQSFPERAKRFLQDYVKILRQALLWGLITFLALGIVSFRENPLAFFGIIVALAIMELIYVEWKIGGRFGRKFVYYAAICILVAFVLSLIPRHAWKKSIGFDVKGFFSSTESEEALSDLEKEQQSAEEKMKAAILEKIQEKIKKSAKKGIRPELTPLEEEFIREMQKERDENSIPGKISSGIQKISLPSIKMPASIPEVGWKTIKSFTFSPNQWSETDYGWQYIMDLPKGEYKIEASGTVNLASIPGGDTDKIQYFPVGVTGLWKKQYFRDKNPLPSVNDGALIAKINGDPIPIGNERKIVVETAEPLRLTMSVNLPHNWEASGRPELNFRHNTGGFKIIIKKII